MRSEIALREVDSYNSQHLASILSTDKKLADALEDKSEPRAITAAEFLSRTKKWQITNNSNTYTIILGEQPIGLISLSHQKCGSARIGYWICSKFWGKGYTTKAFSLLLDIAAQKGFKKVKAEMRLNDVASIRIWQKSMAKLRAVSSKRVLAELKLR